MKESVQVGLVDWDYLVETWKETKSASFYFDAITEKDDWIEVPGSLVFSDWDHARAVATCYTTMRQDLTAANRTKYDRFLGAFFWGDQRHRDLTQPDSEEFFLIMSPDSVSKHLDLWRKLDLKQLRKPFEDHFGAALETQQLPASIKSFDKSIRRFIEQWGDILDEAEDEGLGIVAFIA